MLQEALPAEGKWYQVEISRKNEKTRNGSYVGKHKRLFPSVFLQNTYDCLNKKVNHHILRFLKYVNTNDSEHVTMCIIIPKKEYRV